MHIRNDKMQRLAEIARQYYLEDHKQSDIAREMGVSRPLISRMLKEARDLGIVEIRVHEAGEQGRMTLNRMRTAFGLVGGVLIPDGANDSLTNRSLSEGVLDLLTETACTHVGLGWGHLIGALVGYLEETGPMPTSIREVCPLMGNAGIPIRNYHSNENVRIFAEKTGGTPHFLYLPALAESRQEREVLCGTEVYRQAAYAWEQMDGALVNIGNYPSTPDFASGARFGPLLQQKKACGRLLAYYFNEAGEIIESDNDFAIQIPIDTLSRSRCVIGLCSANTSVRALTGALRTGLFTHIVARETLAAECLALQM